MTARSKTASAEKPSRFRMSADAERRQGQAGDVELADLAATKDAQRRDRTDSDKDKLAGQSNLTGEWSNIALLFLLYTLQGVPMGLAAVFPLVLKERGASFSDLGTFSLNSWPFSLKLLWAPIVDAAYVRSIGRRKTWMVPAQMLIGLVMMWLSTQLDDLLYTDKPKIIELSVLFFFLFFLCATQDIAVDGWALTMLRKENVNYAATVNSVGLTFGHTLGFTGFMALQQFQLTTLPSYMFNWGIIFIICTTAVAAFKSERPVPPEDEPEDVPTAYRQMLAMLSLQPIRALILVFFTWKIGFGIEAALPGKLQELGMPKEHLAYITTLIMPVYILMPIIISGWTAGATPLDVALKAYPFRVFLMPCAALICILTPAVYSPFPWGFYSVAFVYAVATAVANQCVFVSQMSFFARVSDPAMGGTYMTLLNTIGNLGGMWPSTAAMFLIDYSACKGETCIVERDGFTVMTIACTGVGVAWYVLGVGYARRLQHQKPSCWKVR